MSTLVDHHYFDTPRSTSCGDLSHDAPEADMFTLYERPMAPEVITPRIVVNALWVALSADMEAFGTGEVIDPDHVERLGTALASALRNAQER